MTTFSLKKVPKLLSKENKLKLIETSCLRWKKKNPHPKCELYYKTPYQLLVSVVLSAQTTDKMVNRSMAKVYQQSFDPNIAMRLGEKKIYEMIKSIGLANTKAKHIFHLSKKIIEEHQGEVPETRKDLEDLPGVGRKTASVILGEIYHEPTLAVDTHVFRVAFRLGLHREKTPAKAEQVLLALIPKKFLPTAHHWFILHGRYTCKALKPDCAHCILQDLCPSIVRNEDEFRTRQ